MGLGGWNELVFAYVVFVTAHSLPARPPIRSRLIAILGRRGYLSAFGALSLVLLGWLIVAAGRAPYVELWPFAPWQMWVPNIAMPFAILLGTFGFAAANPFSFAGRGAAGFDPDHPGIAGVTRQPVLWAFVLWAGAHLVPNGDLAHVLLFGGFLALALAGLVAVERRRRRQTCEGDWNRLAARTSFFPLAALITRRWHPDIRRLSLRRLAIAAVVWVAFLVLHPIVIGVSPLPPL